MRPEVTDFLPSQPEPTSEKAQQLLVFAEEFVRGGDAVNAMVMANLSDPKYAAAVAARKLLEDPNVQALVAQARKMLGDQTRDYAVSRETQVSRLDSIYSEARMDKDRPAAIAAIKLQSHLQGYLTQAIDLTITHNVADMSTEQLLKMARKYGAIDGDFKVVDVPALEAPEK